jgi:DNA processing protein
MDETACAVALSLAPGSTRFAAVNRLRDAWQAGVLAPGVLSEQAVALAVGERPAIPVAALLERAQLSLARAARAQLTPLPFTHRAYPSLLARLSDPPAVLWVRGQPAVLGQACVAIVGSRAASPGGLLAARRLAADLAASGAVVVSGLARGVDGAAHEGALTAGRTIAVLGCGADRTYPPEHDALAARIGQSGAVVSEFPPGTAPRRHHFPLRNRLISGLSLAVVVVEAAEHSGALITARTALDQGREVMGVPGPVAGGRNRGTHALIRDGALLVESAEDVLAALRLLPRAEALPPALAPPDDEILAALVPGEPVELDALARQTALDPPGLLARVSRLELEGWVERVPGGRIVRLARKW